MSAPENSEMFRKKVGQEKAAGEIVTKCYPSWPKCTMSAYKNNFPALKVLKGGSLLLTTPTT